MNRFPRNQLADYKSATRTVNQQSNLLSCGISLQVHIQNLADEQFISQFRISFLNHLPYFGIYICCRPALETVDGRKEIEVNHFASY